MEMVCRKRQWGWLYGIVFHLFLLAQCTVGSQRFSKKNMSDVADSPPLQLHRWDDYVVVDNGIVNITFSTPEGMVIAIQYNGVDNILEQSDVERDRGYWDVVWSKPEHPGDITDRFEGIHFSVVLEDEDQVELSFKKTYNPSLNKNGLRLNVDKRYIVLRGISGFYSYSIFEHLEEHPAIVLYQGRIVFRLQDDLFRYMAVSDDRQRIMPTAEDRKRGQPLDYPEAVLLTNPSNTFLKGEVDDKYQYSCENKDNRVHGWISADPAIGFWMITPSDEFRTAGPTKQDLTSHAGPITLSMFFSTHYAGISLGIRLGEGESWKKVFGPVFIYLNSVEDESPLELWADAKEQMLIETESWPYDFPLSEDYPYAHERGIVSGRLLVRDRYINDELMTAGSAYVGLAAPGDVGSWQTENKGYQFWTQTDDEGYFLLEDVRVGNYSLYAWVPGFIGDYKYNLFINIRSGSRIKLGELEYVPPRNGATIWEIGIPDRTAAEFYVPQPNPMLLNQLYVQNSAQGFRQYGLWDRYTDEYPDQDLVYTVGVSNYQIDWFFAHVNRNIGNKTYVPTTWQILFDLEEIDESGNYTLHLALASATTAELQVRINNYNPTSPHFTTGLIGQDNAIARHGIHGLYRLYSVNVGGSLLLQGGNVIFLTQAVGGRPFRGIMYDYIRFEQPGYQD
ncbi:Rhamnogalacturonan endolyase [Heracleum sosnowskyi]|uniref:rhamnogalacturonan endolyase n=1 Tax=Heracleum sosnowskyi TaxID=360622 RepID=A0AAD8IUB3_9APIA|nr:Rhamnogalacturonan endolyase [Heracleum sosnowskyi]